MTRYVLEGEWTGYTSAQQRIVHREVISKKLADKIEANKLRCIVYTDGTSLLISVREAKPREKVHIIDSYSSLICEALTKGGSRVLVADL